MNIEFKKMEIQNFKSVGELVEIDFTQFNGLNFVYGKNLDVVNAKNGSGKCVHPDTKIDIKFGDSEVEAKFMEFMKNEKA